MYCESRAIFVDSPRCDDKVTHVAVGEHSRLSASGDGTGRLIWVNVCDSCGKTLIDGFYMVKIIPIENWEAYIRAL